MNLDITHFKQLLEKEKEMLLAQLSSLGQKDDANGTTWTAVQRESEDTADREDVASAIENLEDSETSIHSLETSLHEVEHALSKIQNGTYGLCEISNEPIELDRLEANPSARTCKAHL